MSPFARGLAAAVLALALGAAAAADSGAGVTTIAEGDATLVRGTVRHPLREGVRLAPGDIVETSPQARLLRIEFDAAGYANLGPGTRVLLGPAPADRARPRAPVYLRSGWLKTDAAVLSPAVDVPSPRSAYVLALRPEGAQVFTEAAPLSLVDRREPSRPLTLPAGQLFERAAGATKPVVAARPSPAFLQALPPPFLDTLPALAERFKARPVTPKAAGEVSYADIQPWLTAEPSLRRSLQARWTPLLRQPAFRQALITHLAQHPEWERPLFPERFRPASAPRSAPTPTPAYR